MTIILFYFTIILFYFDSLPFTFHFSGRLSNVDARWNVIAQSVDDRTPAERGEAPIEGEPKVDRPYMAGGGKRVKNRNIEKEGEWKGKRKRKGGERMREKERERTGMR